MLQILEEISEVFLFFTELSIKNAAITEIEP